MGLTNVPARVAEDLQALERKGAECNSSGDFACSEKTYRKLVAASPKDPGYRANLAFALTHLKKHKEAVDIYQKLVSEGEGAYDLFALYAISLEGLKRDDDALIWNYRALLLVPSLVDVRENLAKSLMQKNRGHEAFALLYSFDRYLKTQGQQPYFRGRVMSMNDALPMQEKNPPKEILSATIKDQNTIALSNNGTYIAVEVSENQNESVISQDDIKELGLKADGDKVSIPKAKIGPYAQALTLKVCDRCDTVLGKDVLQNFTYERQKQMGVEFLHISPKK